MVNWGLKVWPVLWANNPTLKLCKTFWAPTGFESTDKSVILSYAPQCLAGYMEASEPKWVNPNDINMGLTHLG